MGANSDAIYVSILSLLGALGVAYLTFRGHIANYKKDLSVDDRKTAKEIRDELRAEIKELRDEVHKWRDRSLLLEDQVREWKDKYSELEIEYYKALLKISDLEKRMDGRPQDAANH